MIIDRVKSILNKSTKQTVLLEDLIIHIAASPAKAREYETFKYDELSEIINTLIDDGILSPMGKKHDNKLHKLSLKYKINKTPETVPMQKEFLDEIKWFHDKLKPNRAIFKDYKMYKEYREQIKAVDKYLKTVERDEIIGINERSYELFNDEKLLSGQDKKEKSFPGLLALLGLNEKDLHCSKHYEPLLVFASSSFYAKNSRVILIIENLDTFWTFQKVIFRDNLMTNIDMVIYGAGNKITGGFNTYHEYGINENDKILYYGDLDSAGFDFYLRIKDENKSMQITLFKEVYEALIDCTKTREKLSNRGEKQIVLPDEKLRKVLQEFTDAEHKEIITKLIKEQKYIPQEALNYALIKERWSIVNG